LQTSVRASDKNQDALSYLRDYSEVFGRVLRTAFSEINRRGILENKKQLSALQKDVCKTLEQRFGILNAEAKNAFSCADAVYESQSELISLYIEENTERIAAIRKSIRKLGKKIKLAKKAGNGKDVKFLNRQIHYKTQRIHQIEAQIAKDKTSKEMRRFRVAFGTKRLLRKQHQLEKNGYSSHAQWLQDWRDARSNRCWFVGSTNYVGGNPTVRYNSDAETLTVFVSPCLQHKYGKVVTLYGVDFKYQKEPLLAAVASVKKTSTRKGKNGESQSTCRNGSASAVTYNLQWSEDRLYINATVDAILQQLQSSCANGALGVDFNPGSIDWAVCDRQGNLLRHGSIKINVQDKRSNQTSDLIGKAVAQIVRVALARRVPVVIEDLDFAKKKASLGHKGKKYARMLSNMAYSQLNKRLEARCSRQGVELVKVDAAYTSVIGVTKYMAMYGLNSGCAAALVVARRGQGRTEKLPASHARFFKRPEDCLKYRAWETLSRKLNICGTCRRHRWYFQGEKQVRSNSPLHGKLRQTCFVKKQTVQVLRTPHIRLKTSANGSLGIST
jgi:IS605 OrfB family transposase